MISSLRLELKCITGHNIKEEAIEKSISKLYSSELYDMVRACLKKQDKKEKKPIVVEQAATSNLPFAQTEKFDTEA